MYTGKRVFSQVMDRLPWHGFHRRVARYCGNRKVTSFSCADQGRYMAFAQITCRESRRDACTSSGRMIRKAPAGGATVQGSRR